MKIYAETILLSTGWEKNRTLTIENGVIQAIEEGMQDTAEPLGVVIPGMVNCHSHAFQRAFAGFSEQGSEGQDSFWTWRKIMYKFLAQLTAENAEVIATQLYIEMLKMGYTRVAEFHYLHHHESGNPYNELSKMANSIFDAAKMAGIGLTLLPVLYQYSGFGELKANQGQQRFINDTGQFNQLVTDCFELSKQYANSNVGIAPHSLRATNVASINTCVSHVKSLNPKAPIHIHISEQQQEVDECEKHFGYRPVEWLFKHCDVDPSWCLIHATHLNENERTMLAKSKAVAGICPTTEANLGDGIFPTSEFLNEEGIFAIGSDSHISVNPIEELRWLEYAQRLAKQKRSLLANTKQPSVGQNLWQQAALGGAQSTHSNSGTLAIGKQADLLVLDEGKLHLFAHDEKHLLDSLIFASQSNVVKDVMVNGQWVVKNGKHDHEEKASQAFKEVLKSLSC